MNNLEIERKFLLNLEKIPYDFSKLNKKVIEQGYIICKPEIRVRNVLGEDYFMTIKGSTEDPLVRNEVEFKYLGWGSHGQTVAVLGDSAPSPLLFYDTRDPCCTQTGIVHTFLVWGLYLLLLQEWKKFRADFWPFTYHFPVCLLGLVKPIKMAWSH